MLEWTWIASQQLSIWITIFVGARGRVPGYTMHAGSYNQQKERVSELAAYCMLSGTLCSIFPPLTGSLVDYFVWF